MFNSFLSKTVLLGTMGLMAIVGSAHSAEQVNPKNLCATNSNCSFGQADTSGVTLFKIKSHNKVEFIRCDTAGRCWRMFPKKGAVRLADLARAFAVK